MTEQAETFSTTSGQSATPARNLLQLIKQLLREGTYSGIQMLFTTSAQADYNTTLINEIGMELYHEVCLPELNESNYENRSELFGCVEELLKLIAAHAPAEELLIELLELIEERKSECMFVSTLRALQVLLLRHGTKKPRALEWTLNSIYSRLVELPLPNYLTDGYDSEQARLLEQDEDVQSIIKHYIMLGYFYEPMLNDIKLEAENFRVFRNCGTNRRNVLCSFLVKLLGKPLALLDLSFDKEINSNSYVQQRVGHIVNAVTQCIRDPFYLLTLVEERARWQRRLNPSKGVYELSCNNYFLIEEKLPLYTVGLYYHALFVGKLCPVNAPKIYAPLFLLESGLYLVTALFSHEEPALHHSALRLTEQLIAHMYSHRIPSLSLELKVHQTFCHSLCNVICYSSQVRLRQFGIRILNQYIEQFDKEGQFVVISNLLRTVNHNGLFGYLGNIYKDLVDKELRYSDNELSEIYRGQNFRNIIMQSVCCLPKEAESDIMDNADKFFCALSTVRYFALRDKTNRTGFWDLIDEIQAQFLEPLRIGLNLSIAHFKAELRNVESRLEFSGDAARSKGLELIDVMVKNAENSNKILDLNISREEKVKVLSRSLLTMDNMMSILGRTSECIELTMRERNPK